MDALRPRFSQAAAYGLIVLLAAMLGGVLSLRRDGIFACPSTPQPSYYLGYCQATSYGDYDYGAFWFNLEPGILANAASADVLYIGNSRGQFAFSSSGTRDWFSDSTRFFRLGFSHNVTYGFEQALLERLKPRAKVYIVNVDLFFKPILSPPSRAVMYDASAPTRYRLKRVWQGIQTRVCGALSAACGSGLALYRSRDTGAWIQLGGYWPDPIPASWDERVDSAQVQAYTSRAQGFLSALGADRSCVILTSVPTVDMPVATYAAMARRLGMELVSPRMDSLVTFDGSHLDPSSATRWSRAFYEAAGARIRQCLSPPDSFPQPRMSGEGP